ncbi:MAG: hypothetical protein CMC14_14175 [Flavobacteriaceae bacterium]|nr:hypothetical protein [Flavobacteriaceae bacterium]
MKKSSIISITILTLSLFLFAQCKDGKESKKFSELAQFEGVLDTSITVSSNVPADLPSGAMNASLAEAANFAWNEFIALNWPAVSQTGAKNTRDVPDGSKFFGDQSVPLVWHTYRSKVEMYPWKNLPNGTTLQGDTLLVYNYDAKPKYFYKDSIPPCASASSDVAFINLDETSEISLNFMFAGINPKTPTATNSSPQLVRFLAKGNRTYFDYITSKSYFNHGGDYYDAIINYSNAVATDTVATDSTVFFPTGTVMLKAAWRLLTSKDSINQYHTTKVRYYEKKNGNPCYYEDATWGLIALHIVHKTPTAPYFTFATFEQKDNILTTDGKPVEDANGNVINPFTDATTPVVSHTDSPSGTTTTISDPYCDANDSRLYYQNTAAGLPSDGSICVNGRYHNIPQAIINANKAAHNAFKAYNNANGVTSSPWENYKLVNIQYKPFNFNEIDSKNNLLSTYFQANIVVETNYTLQKFAGQQIATGNEAGQTSNFAGGQPFYNVHLPNGNSYDKINMGGCMGCHGNAQFSGNDFSFMLRGGPVIEPDVPEFDSINVAKLVKKYRFY